MCQALAQACNIGYLIIITPNSEIGIKFTPSLNEDHETF